MTLADCLDADRVLVPLEVEDLAEALRALLDRAPEGAAPPPELRAKLSRDLAFGSVGEVQRLSPDVVAVVAPHDSLGGTVALAGIAPRAFRVTAEGRDEPGKARVVVLFITSRRMTLFRAQTLPALSRWLKENDHARRLLAAESSDEVMALPGLSTLRLEERLRVEAALVPVTYRVYPDTPLEEVVDLMVRRELHAVPVVGKDYEVMGIVTAADALRDLLPRRRAAEDPDRVVSGAGATARDVMTRAVMCVSDEQPLMEAATLMMNRDVEQLPVVREGTLVGFLTRDAVLRTLFGR